MISAADLPDSVPLFPLPGAVILPRAYLPLQIFEPRFLAMLEDTLKTPHRLIGMIQPDGDGPVHGLHEFGSAGRVTAFNETDDGRYLITLTGVSRFRVVSELNGFTPYQRAQVDWSDFQDDLGREENDPGFNREQFIPLLQRYLKHNELSTDWDSVTEAGDELIINSLSMMLPFEPEDKQALLEAPKLADRRKILETLMEFGLHGDGGEVMQ